MKIIIKLFWILFAKSRFRFRNLNLQIEKRLIPFRGLRDTPIFFQFSDIFKVWDHKCKTTCSYREVGLEMSENNQAVYMVCKYKMLFLECFLLFDQFFFSHKIQKRLFFDRFEAMIFYASTDAANIYRASKCIQPFSNKMSYRQSQKTVQ